MSRYATVNLLEIEDSVGERAPGIEGRFGRKHLDSRDLGVSLFQRRPFALTPEGDTTRIVLDHAGYPDGTGEHLDAGWHPNYWEPLARRFP